MYTNVKRRRAYISLFENYTEMRTVCAHKCKKKSYVYASTYLNIYKYMTNVDAEIKVQVC